MTVLTLIIGLERDFRGKPLEHQLRRISIRSERSPGVEGEYDGLPLSRYANTEEVEVLYGRPLRRGEIGCALAHRECYRRLLASDSEWALVFEDDARIARPDALAELTDSISRRQPLDTPAVIMLYGRQMVGDPALRATLGGSEVHGLLRTPMTATAYFINRAAAQHILATGMPLRNPADWPISVEGQVRFAGVHPWIAIPDETGVPSSIGGRGGDLRALTAAVNRLEAITFVKWLKHRRHYRSLREYRDWEIRRRFVHLALGKSYPYRVPDDARGLPVAGRLPIAVDRLLGGRRNRQLIEHLTSAAGEANRGGHPDDDRLERPRA